MTAIPILSRFVTPRQTIKTLFRFFKRPKHLKTRPNLSQLAQNPAKLPRFVRESPVAMRYLHLLGPLAWDQFPERNLNETRGVPPMPYAPFVAACLVKLNQGFVYMSQLREFLAEHPALMWVLGFQLVASRYTSWGFDAEASLPTHRHFTRMLRTIPNAVLQFLLDSAIHLLQAELASVVDDFGQAISMDTKHIVAWVKENNPKAYLKNSERYDKKRQPKGDPDCRLGCKRRRNQRASAKESPPTPPDNPVPANTISVGEFYWGYGSGVVATKVPDWGEFVLAELTQPFNRSDVSYFSPLMGDVERRLDFRPRWGAFDASFDAWYVYAHFHRQDQTDPDAAFAAVPFSVRGGHRLSFDPDGLPLCKAGLPMPLKSTYWSKRSLVEHECGIYVCSLRFPAVTDQVCPIEHKNWSKKHGCTTRIPTSIGARIRYQLDRQGDAYKLVYKQRTATERVNSQAVALGIERPKIRNGHAIANQNTLIYVLINLRALHRVRRRKARLGLALA